MPPRVLVLALLLVLTPGLAMAAPEPTKAVDMNRLMGRWHEILRTPNDHQRNCWAASQVWSARSDGRYSIRQTCRRGSRTGPVRNFDTVARVLNAPENTKFEASFFAGLIRQRYWIIDRADDYSWMIATTADGQFPALLARTPTLSAAETNRLKARMRALGLPTARLTPSEG